MVPVKQPTHSRSVPNIDLLQNATSCQLKHSHRIVFLKKLKNNAHDHKGQASDEDVSFEESRHGGATGHCAGVCNAWQEMPNVGSGLL